MTYKTGPAFAAEMDSQDPLKSFRSEFLFPKSPNGKGEAIYLCGNSLGLQPRKARAYVEEVFKDWEELGVEGHFHAKHSWMPYHENLTESTARLVGAKPIEVVVMNTLTVNLHLMMVSFYRPTRERYKILVEGGAFPSDQYAVASQVRFHGYEPHGPEGAIIELKPRAGEEILRREDILATIEREGATVALVLLGNVNYLTGQCYDMAAITKAAQARGARVGFDLAHGAGNLLLKLHDWNVDFAVWCSYKYMNGGPGALSGCFVHERHAHDKSLPRFAGWWGHNKAKRFEMKPEFDPIPGAEGWQLSNAPIFQLASIRAAMEQFDRATMPEIRRKGDLLTGYLEFLLDELAREGAKGFSITTPRNPAERGNQLSLKVANGKAFLQKLNAGGVIADFREPDIVRVSPAPLYNSFSDVYQFALILREMTQS